MKQTRFLMVGGFLGAGKTTAIARLARHYIDRGLAVGVITNDQAFDLVDTQSLRAEGLNVGEVSGACFCCQFDDLIETASKLAGGKQPDVILAEPVGSCTDLVATVIEPLKHFFPAEYEIGPYTVLLKPEHGRKILREEGGMGFSQKAAYIFLKQIEEADVVAVNKIDKLPPGESDELVGLVDRRFPGKTVLSVSARTGEGFDALIEAVGHARPAAERPMEMDYDVYAEGEAELGWLNCTVRLESPTKATFPLDDLLLDLVSRLRETLLGRNAETAHLKVLGRIQEDAAIVNLVSSGDDVELSRASTATPDAADLIINARVAVDPLELEQITLDTLAAVAGDYDLTHSIGHMRRFRPARPVPTHRMPAS